MGLGDQFQSRQQARPLYEIHQRADELALRACFMNKAGDQLPL
jgi:hypothetical protein